MMNSIKTSLPIALHARNSPRWVHSVIENVRRKGVGSVGLYPFIQALESVTEKRIAIPCENLVTDQIRKDCWIEKLSKFLGESVRSRNCSSFFCYGFLAKDTGYRPAYPTPLRRTSSNYQLTNLNSHLLNFQYIVSRSNATTTSFSVNQNRFKYRFTFWHIYDSSSTNISL